MTFQALFRDNPLLIKHARSRLRTQQIVPYMIVVGLVCGCILWGVASGNAFKDGAAYLGILLVQAGLLLLVGTSEVATAVASARESGTLDFHRISPQPPSAIAVGFIIGAALREWVMFAVTLPFSLVAIAFGPPGPLGLLATLVVLVCSALLFHTLAALAGATSPRARGVSGGLMFLVFLLHSSGGWFFTVIPTVTQLLSPEKDIIFRDLFFGVKLPLALHSLLHILPVLALLFVATVRKLQSEVAPVYSKRQAMVFQAVLSLLVLGDVLGLTQQDLQGLAPLIAVYALFILGCLLLLAVTPDAGAFAKGVRRARKQGLAEQSPWADGAANWNPLLGFAASIVVIGLLSGVQDLLTPSRAYPFYCLLGAIVTAVGALVAFGSARQYLSLRYKKAGLTYFGLFLFVAWVLPLPIAMIAGIAGNGHGMDEVTKSILALSPFTGIGLAGTPGERGALPLELPVAVVVALVWAAVTLYLRLQAERDATAEALRGK